MRKPRRKLADRTRRQDEQDAARPGFSALKQNDSPAVLSISRMSFLENFEAAAPA
jgi:hypothetical protein